mmetsp:Transcript_51823/g.133639  ORF Transcript_51823/g.133639 Transcript_51823/m.133639 type:complete len:265 (+) Transcript_51823:895-1689(+)
MQDQELHMGLRSRQEEAVDDLEQGDRQQTHGRRQHQGIQRAVPERQEPLSAVGHLADPGHQATDALHVRHVGRKDDDGRGGEEEARDERVADDGLRRPSLRRLHQCVVDHVGGVGRHGDDEELIVTAAPHLQHELHVVPALEGNEAALAQHLRVLRAHLLVDPLPLRHHLIVRPLHPLADVVQQPVHAHGFARGQPRRPVGAHWGSQRLLLEAGLRELVFQVRQLLAVLAERARVPHNVGRLHSLLAATNHHVEVVLQLLVCAV